MKLNKLFRLKFKPLSFVSFLILIYTILPTISVSQVYNDLPAIFPDFNINISNNPGPGNYFMSGSYFGSQSITYTIILDTLGMPIYYQKHADNSIARGFTRQENGFLSFYSRDQYSYEGKHVILDSTYNVLKEIDALNGFYLDPHELIINEDGSYWILAFDIREVDMSVIINGGHPNATVIGCVIQHISESQNLLFQWNSWDHFEITDCDTLFVDLRDQTIDYVHANSLALDYDGNVLLSSRHLNEITKIDVNSGSIIWRWGGKNNQFTFQEEARFYGQHTIRFNEASNTYTLFDNGNWHLPPVSRGLEFELNQNQLNANLIQSFDHDPVIYSDAMGGMQRMSDGNTIVNWSKNLSGYIFNEYDEDGNIIFEISCPDSIIVSYRVLKYEWKTSLFDFVDEELVFNDVVVGDSASQYFTVVNNQNYPVSINGFNIENPVFSLETTLPIIIGPNETEDFLIKFKPEELNSYKSLLSLFHSTDTSRIAQQIRILGSTTVGTEEFLYSLKKDLIIYPNPTQLGATISLPDNQKFNRLMVFDNMGKLILDKKIDNQKKVHLSSKNMKTGVYNIVLFSSQGVHSGKLLVVY